MAIDTGIYGLSGRGVKSVNDYDREFEALLGAKQDRQMGALQLMLGQQKADEYTRGIERGNQLRALSGTWRADTTDEQRVASLRNAGFANEADALEKGILERMKTRATVDKDSAEAASKRQGDKIRAYEFHVQRLGQIATPEDAAAWLTQGVQSGAMSMQEAQQGLAALKSVPFDRWKALTREGGMSVVEQLKAQEAQRTATRMDAAAADTRANQKLVPDGRGGYMVNEPLVEATSRIARAGASNISMGLGSPVAVTGPDGRQMLVQPPNKAGGRAQVVTIDGIPVVPASEGKPLNDTQGKANAFGTRAQEANAIIQRLASQGVELPSLPQSLTGGEGVTGAIATALASPQQQQIDQAQRDFINAVLRRESGAVISPQEFANARKQYFALPGDSDAVKAQKARNREVSIAGILAEVPEGKRGVNLGAPAPVLPKSGAPQAAPAMPPGIPAMDAIEAELRRRQGGK